MAIRLLIEACFSITHDTSKSPVICVKHALRLSPSQQIFSMDSSSIQPPLPCGLGFINGNSYSQFLTICLFPAQHREYMVARAWCVQLHKRFNIYMLIWIK